MNCSLPQISLVVPGKNAAKTLPACLHAACQLFDQGLLHEIILVDDGSTDATSRIAASFGPAITLLLSGGRGPAAARNVGWQAATGDWVWFIDSDCVANAASLHALIQAIQQAADQTDHSKPERVAGVGGSYTNLNPRSLLANWIQAEIAARHARMQCWVEFLGSFNVVYNRGVLAEVGGFDERRFPAPSAEDNDLAYRLRSRGYRLRFEADSTVGHFHPTQWGRYLRTQARHGYYRTVLYFRHPTRLAGDSYSGPLDYVQPLLALALPLAMLFDLWLHNGLMTTCVVVGLLWSTLPMTWRVYRQRGKSIDFGFALLSLLRAFARGGGLLLGLAEVTRQQLIHCVTGTLPMNSEHEQPA